ncbi:hypothetical protein [Amycolatopsis sp. DG1A-15b]|uniref:hypothetical protein n=1 Tax=Amycolatopsis sp. DG1A-15b TaxID=3052846 RepID=UPI00255C246C|nr:hypothetical protein [Amycolatopsis sp. DG1A-15b]WIX88822.1 hypothetical protein QRY02_48260 [Amycolatopsis sp. DG1A-15b]
MGFSPDFVTEHRRVLPGNDFITWLTDRAARATPLYALSKSSEAAAMTVFFRLASASWVLVAAWILFVILAYLLVGSRRIPFGASYVKNISGVPVLDTRFAFRADQGAAALQALGEVGRRHHAYFQIADLGFVLVYVVALPGALFALFGNAIPAMVPVLGALADLVEDFGILLALHKFPAPARSALAAAGAAGVVKHICFWPSLIAVVAGVGFVLIRRFFHA